jgi:spore coat protein U-like protein
VTQTYSTILSFGIINFTTFGRVPAGQYVATGTYNDTITVTVTY